VFLLKIKSIWDLPQSWLAKKFSVSLPVKSYEVRDLKFKRFKDNRNDSLINSSGENDRDRAKLNVGEDDCEVGEQISRPRVRVDDFRRECVRVRAIYIRVQGREIVERSLAVLILLNCCKGKSDRSDNFPTIPPTDKQLPTINDSKQSVRHRLVLED
jgi:hypothetical protein